MVRPVVLLLFALAAAPALALHPHDLYEMRSVAIGDLSPDGTRLIYSVSAHDHERDATRTTVTLRNLETGQETVLFTPEDEATGFAWRPDGLAVAYRRAGADGTEVWLMDAGGANRRRIAGAGEWGRLVWAPDGSALAHIVDDAVTRVPVQPGVVVADDLGYRHLHHGYRGADLGQLHILDVATGQDLHVVTPDLDVRQVAWSPDAQRLVICAKRRADLGLTLNTDLFVLGRNGGELRQLTAGPGPQTNPVWLADGRVACQSHDEPLHESAPAPIVLLDAETGDETGRLAARFDDVIRGFAPHAGEFYFLAMHRGAIDVFRATADGGERLTPGARDFWDARYGGGRAVLQGAGQTLPGALFTLDLASGKLSLLLDPNERWRERVGLVEPQPFVVAVEDREIHGWIFLPPDLAPGQRAPTVLSIHGGPEWMYGGYFLSEFHVLPTYGYAVIIANPTGSTGYGRTFQDGVRGDWGGRPARELLACLDWAIAQGWADPERVAVMGGSYGGHLAAELTTQTDRFRAAACDRMYPETVGFWGTTDEKWFPEWEFFGRPWEPGAREIYRLNSPFERIQNVTTPTLISHGMRDYRCRPAGSEMWFSALQVRGIPTRMIRFEDEGHGIRDRENQVFYLEQLLEWFDRHVLGEPQDD